jgi:competence protein ComEA
MDAVDSARAARRDATRASKRRTKPPTKRSAKRSVTQLTPGARVDVDVADSATLDALPGIGPALAARIVADRAAHGAYGTARGLERVRGIGPALVKRVSPHVTFSGIPRPTDAADGSASRDASAAATRRKSGPRR